MAVQTATATVPLRRSIRAALYGASAAKVLMTLLAAGIGALSAERLGALVDELATRTVPLLEATHRLTQAETEIAAIAPSILSSQNPGAVRAVQDALAPSQMTLDEGIAALAAMPGIAARAAELAQTNKTVRILLDHIMAIQQRRLLAAAARAAAVAGVVAAHHDLTAALGSVLDDARSDLRAALSVETGPGDTRAGDTRAGDTRAGDTGAGARTTGTALAQLRDNQLDTLISAGGMRSDANLVMGLLTFAASAPDRTLLAPLADQVTAAQGRMTKALNALGHHRDVTPLRAKFDALSDYAAGASHDVFALHARELDAIDEAWAALAENRRLSGQVAAGVLAVTQDTWDAVENASNGGRKAVVETWRMLLVISGFSVAGSLVLAWLFIGRHVLRRLTRLQASMLAVASDDLDADVVSHGHDEIAAMARALLSLRDSRRLSEQRLEDYVATASDWYWETNDAGHFTRIAEQVRDHGIEPGDLMGLDRLTEDDADDEVTRRQAILARQQSFRDMRYDYAGERGLLTLSLSGLPIFASDGTFQGYRGSTRDITAQLQAEATQRSARWAAEEANRAKSTFLATMSHEIRTPMNGVLGMVQILSDTALDQDQRRMCDVIYQSGNSLQQILNDILDYSKLEAGKITLEQIGASLIDIVDSVVGLMRGTAEAKGLAIEVEAGAVPLPPVVIDPTRLRQVLFNLVSNAIKFSEQGVVSIRLLGVPAGQDRLAITLAVTDEGIGMSLEAQQRLFVRFSQADASTTRRFGGTGLGLAITKELVALMGGTIGVHSAPGQGTTFQVKLTLPVAEAIVGPVAPARWAGQVANARVLDILVAEDDMINQEVIRGLLRGHRLTVTGNGREAVEAVRAGHYDLVLMDVMMPVMDGLKATAAIRALASPAATLPIIALTANSMSGDQERYLAEGMNGYVSKPIDRQRLFEVIERVTGSAVLRPRAAASEPVSVPAPSRQAAREVEDFVASLDLGPG
jgi:signal transduction histidine kinase/CheY-like chemotaxis protein